ncbi:ubiquitin-related domain-containing protein, partial [Entophlyctis helioformis]
QQITININSLTGKSFQMSLSNTHTIGDLKLCIARDHGIPYESQRLVFRDKTLGPDEAVLASFGLQTGSSLYLVLHMAGG